MRFVRNILILSSLLASSSAKQAVTQEDEVSHFSPRQLLANTKARKGLKHGLTFPTMKDKPLAKEMFSSRVKQKKRSIIPSSSFLVRHLIKNGNGQMIKLPSMAKSFLSRKAQESSGGMFRVLAEPGWADKYQETIDAIIDLFIDMLAQTDFDPDDLFSPSDYCNYSEMAAAEPEVCEETVSAFMTLASNFAYHPWVAQDILFFVIGNISMLPLEYILDWENLREFLHSIPKEFIYDDVVLPFISMVWEAFYWEIMDAMPVLFETFYMEFESSGLLEDGSADFASLLSYFIGDDIVSKEIVDMIHTELCYAATLEKVWVDFDSGCATSDWNMDIIVTDVPFCMYREFKEEMFHKELFQFEGGDDEMRCEIRGYFSETMDDEVVIENPQDEFMMFDKNNELVEQKCKWLRKQKFNVRRKACSVPPEFGAEIAIKVCPSSCCVSEEVSSSIFLKKVDVVGGMEVPITQTCGWLSGKSENVINKFCKKNKGFPDYSISPAYVMCPETCGICESKDL